MRKLREQGHPGARWVGSERLGDAPPEKEQRMGIGGSLDVPDAFPLWQEGNERAAVFAYRRKL
jgi:hypothetical protein